MVWAEADTGHHTPGRWLPRYTAADNLGGGTLVTRSLLVAGRHFHHVGALARGSFVTVLPACDVHIKVDVFGWGNGIARLQ